MSQSVLYIIAKLAALMIGALGVMLGAVWLVAVAQGRSFAPQGRAVVVVWLAFAGSFVAGIVAAVVLVQDITDRIAVFALVMLGIFVPFVLRSEAMKKLC